MDRLNYYREKESAQRIAKETGGEFIDEVFEDNIGKYWIVIWRGNDVRKSNAKQSV